MFNDGRAKFIAEILKDIGQVLFASVFVGPLISGASNYFIILSGLILAAFAWSLSLIVVK